MDNSTSPNDRFIAQVQIAEKEFFAAAATYLVESDLAYLRRALLLAHDAHYGQFRHSGEHYISHPIAVATLLTEWHLDAKGLAAALLHDVLEDTGVSKSTLAKAFGDTVADLVDGLSKLENLAFQTKEAAQAENFRKMILAMSRDIRVIIIKLADRLHNMRTMAAMRPDKQLRIAKETLEIYAPIANRLGLEAIYRELEELGFRYLYPRRYAILTKALKTLKAKQMINMEKILHAIKQQLNAFNIQGQVSSRVKSMYSIHQKMQRKKLSFSEVLDLYGFRVTVNTLGDYYLTLGALHTLYKPIPGKFKDYIAIPKNNGYQSLHTVLFSPFGSPIEVQIRTNDMQTIAESGIASHWMYKEIDHSNLDRQALFNETQQRTHQWLQKMLALQAQTHDSVELLEHIKLDLFPDDVYIFTPKGKIMVLPRGSTVIDFAYAIHTDIGHRTIAAKVNFINSPLDTVLHSGHTVEIMTQSEQRPDPLWLDFVTTSRARTAIRHWLKKMEQQKALVLGKQTFQRAWQSLTGTPNIPNRHCLEAFIKQSSMPDDYAHINEAFIDIGLGISAHGQLGAMMLAKTIYTYQKMQNNDTSPTILPVNTTVMTLAACCQPLHGDPIIGVYQPKQALFIHRMHCEQTRIIDADNILPLRWPNKPSTKHCSVAVVIHTLFPNELMSVILAIVDHHYGLIQDVDRTKHPSKPYTMITLKLHVAHYAQLNQLLAHIRLHPLTLSARRLP
jgi:GTP pyrophosphokinase/guanosine-3',5'-bis(diphosphate) 3'-pyrophosphohydrolase